MDSTLSSDDWSEIDEPGPYNEELGRCKCCRIWHFKEDWTQYCSTFGNDGYLLEAHRYSKHPRNTVTRSLWETWPGDGRVLETSQSGKSDNWERWPNTSSVCRSATYPAATRQAGNDWSTTMFLINQPLTKFRSSCRECKRDHSNSNWTMIIYTFRLTVNCGECYVLLDIMI